jgi:hypothetical protein
MQYAILNNQRIEPSPHQKAKCPCCNKDVIAKCGE